MGARTVSPGGALLRSSRMFAMPKPLPEIASVSSNLHGSDTATRPFPQRQSITSPLGSREKGDWGLKRSLPLKQTMATTTPLVRIKQLDSIEKITDYASAADHSLSLEKFGEMRIAMSIPQEAPRSLRQNNYRDSESVTAGLKSVFEEDMDFTTAKGNSADDRRWKFRGPWLARMSEGDFMKYLDKHVRPKRAEFRALLRRNLAEQMTNRQNSEARDAGKPLPPKVEAKDIAAKDFTQYLRLLRDDRVSLYALISKFLDLAPLGKPIGFNANSGIFWHDEDSAQVSQSPYGTSGPPPSHPSAGISYLRTNAVMDNHAVYGPQAHRAPVLSRIISPRFGAQPAKLGVGGFVATVPVGDNAFNVRSTRGRGADKKPLNGISHLDINTFGGAKAYVDPYTASVDPEGKIAVKVREAGAEATVVAKEAQGQSTIYNNAALKRTMPTASKWRGGSESEARRMEQVAEEVLDAEPEASSAPEKDIVSSSSSYGLDPPKKQ